jgi:hypothetical protein
VDASLRSALNDTEFQMVSQTDRDALAVLDEDGAIELEARIRRARDKFVSQYRRTASARVAEHAARGRARPQNAHAAAKAEAFERALAQVSRRVAVLARRSAAALRAERLAAPGPRSGRTGREPEIWCPDRLSRDRKHRWNPWGRWPGATPSPRSTGPGRWRRAPAARRSATAGTRQRADAGYAPGNRRLGRCHLAARLDPRPRRGTGRAARQLSDQLAGRRGRCPVSP